MILIHCDLDTCKVVETSRIKIIKSEQNNKHQKYLLKLNKSFS